MQPDLCARRDLLIPAGVKLFALNLHLTLMSSPQSRPSLVPRDFLNSWWQILQGRVPLLSIEITRECPLSCPGCYAYGDSHLGGAVTLRELSDSRGDGLVDGVLGLVRKHRPLQVSLVGGEPLVRHRELDRILPAISEMGVAHRRHQRRHPHSRKLDVHPASARCSFRRRPA